jgi:D-galactarolactone cycloisomerase
MVDANHAYNLNDALYVGRGLDELDIFWFEEPVAPEDYDGYRELNKKLILILQVGKRVYKIWMERVN